MVDALIRLNGEWWLLPPVLALVAGVLALAPLGAQVLRRGVVFIDLAVAQAAAAGALVAMALGDHPPWWVSQATAAAGALLAAGVVATLARAWPAHREALIGLVYVLGACAALLTARQDPHGAEHLHALLAADVLWSDWPQVAVLAACAAAVGLARHRLGQDTLFFVTFALVASLAVQALGLFVVFAALIAPGLWQRAGFGAATATTAAIAAALGGLAASWWLDAPSGPLVALSLALFGVASTAGQRRTGAG
jgi:zinc/manganese transport system permease protein